MQRILLSLLVIGTIVTRVGAQDAPAADAPAEPAAKAPAAEPAASAAPQPAGAAVAAKQAFDALVAKWGDLLARIKQFQADRAVAAAGDRAKFDEQIAALRKDAEGLVADIAKAGVDVYRADAEAFAEVNSTVLRIVQHYIAGNAAGDGGDQYEKALPVIKSLIDAGAAQTWPELWLWGGVAAYSTNDFALAKQYLDKAAETGALGSAPPVNDPNDPRLRIWDMGTKYRQSLAQVSKAWEKEQEIRAAEAQADDLPRVKLTTTRGDIVIELFENEAPQAVASFINLVKSGFYDGLTFHRVIPGFMAQGGDPKGTGSGGPGYSIRCECFQPNYRHHFRGSLSMAHAGRNTGGSQFFITFVPTTPLDGKHTVFGRVVEGIDAASAFQRRIPESGSPNLATSDRILKAEVLRDRGHEYKFEKLPAR